MNAGDIIREARYQLNDTDKIEFSDAELLSYINQALRYINEIGINLNSNLLLKRADLTLTDGVASLPSDFIREKVVRAGKTALQSNRDYQIIGDKIYSDYENLTVEYFYQFPLLISVSDILPVKDVFTDVIKQIVIFLALNRTNVNAKLEVQLSELYKAELERIFKMYGHTRLYRKPPFAI